MCLLIASNNAFPPIEVMTKAEASNGDGAGIAYIENNKVNWVKGLTAQDLLEFECKGPPYIIHFRMASIGGKRKELCHPFPITEKVELNLKGQAEAVLAHNGHWAGWRDKGIHILEKGMSIPSGPWSDTRMMAWLTYHFGLEFLDLLNEKVAVLNSKGNLEIFGDGWYFDKPNTAEEIAYSYNPFTTVRNFTSYGAHFNEWERQCMRGSGK